MKQANPILVFDSNSSEVLRGHQYPSQGNFWISYDWFALLYDTSLQSDHEALIITNSSSDDGEAAALFLARSRAQKAVTSMTNFYAMEFAPSVIHSRTAATQLASGLIAQLCTQGGRPRSLELHLLRNDQPWLDAFKDALQSNQFDVEVSASYKNWYTRPNGQTFADYFAARPSQVRNTISRKEKKLNKEHAFEIRITTSASDDGFERAVKDYIAIYNSSWKRPEPYPRFIPGLIQECAKLGILRLGIAYVDGTPAAAQLWVTTQDKALIYKLAYDERFAALSVGSILTREMFRLALDVDRTPEIDYGIGDESYKRDWMSDCRQFYSIHALDKRSVGGAAGVALKKIKALIKTIIRRS